MASIVDVLAPPMIPLDPVALMWTMVGVMIFFMLFKQFLIYMGKREEQRIMKLRIEKAAEERNSLRLTETFREYEK